MSEPAISAQLTDLRVAMARVETAIGGIVETNKGGDEVHKDHEQRLRRLERWMFLLTGAAATLGSSAGVVVSRLLGGS